MGPVMLYDPIHPKLTSISTTPRCPNSIVLHGFRLHLHHLHRDPRPPQRPPTDGARIGAPPASIPPLWGIAGAAPREPVSGHALPHQWGRAARGWGLHIGDEAALPAVTVGQSHQTLQGIGVGVEEVGLCGVGCWGLGRKRRNGVKMGGDLGAAPKRWCKRRPISPKPPHTPHMYGGGMEQHPMGWDAWGEPLCVPPTQGTFSVHRFGVKHPKKHPGVGGPQAAMGQRCAYGTLGGAAPCRDRKARPAMGASAPQMRFGLKTRMKREKEG